MSDDARYDSPELAAALLLLGQELLPGWKGKLDTEAEILAATGATRDEAMEMCDKLQELLSTVLRESLEASPAERVACAVQGYLSVHANAVREIQGCRTYSNDFRSFILSMRDPGEVGVGLSLAEVALASGIPLETIEEWTAARRPRNRRWITRTLWSWLLPHYASGRGR